MTRTTRRKMLSIELSGHSCPAVSIVAHTRARGSSYVAVTRFCWASACRPILSASVCVSEAERGQELGTHRATFSSARLWCKPRPQPIYAVSVAQTLGTFSQNELPLVVFDNLLWHTDYHKQTPFPKSSRSCLRNGREESPEKPPAPQARGCGNEKQTKSPRLHGRAQGVHSGEQDMQASLRQESDEDIMPGCYSEKAADVGPSMHTFSSQKVVELKVRTVSISLGGSESWLRIFRQEGHFKWQL
ncbi:hypothetical protein FOMPIDRAFT_1020947 [Fomitopsis schrenkii]|uniref:Uncharacterized protein n=1 Tax=Fomitopsis schrenkii TaxID=2126942 RepID=S8F0U6_FOMSC|nr:hypothetical protein FOMPIDRAFT_1020947 [Fomitopsis schrenkii]